MQTLERVALVALALSAALVSGCAPKIGDHCQQNADCGTSGTLVCDTSLPFGYCTQFNCTPDVCQNKAACVALEPAVPGCPYDDYHSPSRTNRTLCLAQCQSDSDCRQGDGYVCADPRQAPWSVAIIDDVQSQRVCIPAFSSPAARRPVPDGGQLPEGSVCSASGPQLDAALVFATDAGADDSGGDAGDASADASDGSGADAPAEAPADGAGDGAPDAAPGSDGAADASSDAGAADAPDGG